MEEDNDKLSNGINDKLSKEEDATPLGTPSEASPTEEDEDEQIDQSINDGGQKNEFDHNEDNADDFLADGSKLSKSTIIPYMRERVKTICFDAASDDKENISKLQFYTNRCDIILILFCMSAIQPERFSIVKNTVKRLLKDGGILLFRDYAKYDWTEVRFNEEKHKPAKLQENFYTRYDGTLTYFFTKEDGFQPLENGYHFREITNRQLNKTMKRI